MHMEATQAASLSSQTSFIEMTTTCSSTLQLEIDPTPRVGDCVKGSVKCMEKSCDGYRVVLIGEEKVELTPGPTAPHLSTHATHTHTFFHNEERFQPLSRDCNQRPFCFSLPPTLPYSMQRQDPHFTFSISYHVRVELLSSSSEPSSSSSSSSSCVARVDDMSVLPALHTGTAQTCALQHSCQFSALASLAIMCCSPNENTTFIKQHRMHHNDIQLRANVSKPVNSQVSVDIELINCTRRCVDELLIELVENVQVYSAEAHAAPVKSAARSNSSTHSPITVRATSHPTPTLTFNHELKSLTLACYSEPFTCEKYSASFALPALQPPITSRFFRAHHALRLTLRVPGDQRTLLCELIMQPDVNALTTKSQHATQPSINTNNEASSAASASSPPPRLQRKASPSKSSLKSSLRSKPSSPAAVHPAPIKRQPSPPVASSSTVRYSVGNTSPHKQTSIQSPNAATAPMFVPLYAPPPATFQLGAPEGFTFNNHSYAAVSDTHNPPKPSMVLQKQS